MHPTAWTHTLREGVTVVLQEEEEAASHPSPEVD